MIDVSRSASGLYRTAAMRAFRALLPNEKARKPQAFRQALMRLARHATSADVLRCQNLD